MDTQSIIPIPDAPLVVGDRITEVWFRFLLQLFSRTGGSEGVDVTKIIANIRDLQQSAEAESYGGEIASLQAALNNLTPGDVAPTILGAIASRLADVEGQLSSMVGTASAPSNEPPVDVYTHGTQLGGDLHSVATSTIAGFMSAADKQKLDVYSPIAMTPVAVIANITAQNSTADVDVYTASIPANRLAIGSTFHSNFMLFANAAASAGTFNMWIKVNGTKVLIATLTVPLLGLASQPISSEIWLTVRTIGASGTCQASSSTYGPAPLFGNGTEITVGSGTIDTTATVNLAVGINWSVANLGNVAIVRTGLLRQEK